MKTFFAAVAAFMIATAVVVVAGCGPKAGTFGRALTETQTTAIGDILTRPQEFDQKTVRVEGTIAEECPAGGWFMLKDTTGVIYVDLHPSEIAIPQARGSSVAAEGTVKKEGTRVTIEGKGVHIQ